MSTPRQLRPPGVRRLELDTARGRFAALEATQDSGRLDRHPALLVPGFTGSKEDFSAIMRPLATSGRRVVAIDMRGQYESIGDDDPNSYTAGVLGADVAEIVRTFGGPVHLLGHSLGGIVAREAALDHDVDLASLTLMCSGPAGVRGAKATEGRAVLQALSPPDGSPPRTTVARLWAENHEPAAIAAGTAPEIVAFLRERMLASSPVGLVVMAREVLDAPDRVEELAGLDPILVLYGENDDVWQPAAQAAMAKRLAARRVVIPDAGHSPAVEAPETTAGALTEFWNAAERADACPR